MASVLKKSLFEIRKFFFLNPSLLNRGKSKAKFELAIPSLQPMVLVRLYTIQRLPIMPSAEAQMISTFPFPLPTSHFSLSLFSLFSPFILVFFDTIAQITIEHFLVELWNGMDFLILFRVQGS